MRRRDLHFRGGRAHARRLDNETTYYVNKWTWLHQHDPGEALEEDHVGGRETVGPCRRGRVQEDVSNRTV